MREVLPGTPEDLDELAAQLERYVDGVTTAARGLREMDSGGWIGTAAAAFWDSVGGVMKKLDTGAEAFQEAALALRAYTATLREAQGDVRRGLTLIDEAESETRLWAARNGETLVENLTSSYTGTVLPLPSDDPGEALRHQAGDLITEAKGRVASAAHRAADRLHTAAEHAPSKPGFWERRWHNMTEFAAGTVEATAGMATFTFELSPAYAIVHPDRYVEHQVAIVKGLAHGVTHPVDFAKAFVDWDTWAQSPGRALGHLLPLVALTIASAGGGAGGKAVEASEVAEGLAATEGLEGIAQEGLERLGSAPGLTAGEEAGAVRAAGGIGDG